MEKMKVNRDFIMLLDMSTARLFRCINF